MTGQGLIVALIVAACAAQAVWALMPNSLRQRAAARWFGRKLPAPAGGCGSGCGGCGAAASPSAQARPMPDGVRPLVFQPRKPR